MRKIYSTLLVFLVLMIFAISCTPTLMQPTALISSGSTATPLPPLNVSPLTQNFGSMNVNSTSYAQTFTFSNSGSTDATGCSAPSLSGTNASSFSILLDACSTNNLIVGGNCNVVAVAEPTTSGVQTATLSRVCTVGGTISTTANAIQTTGASALVKPMIAGGYLYSCALFADGTVKCWGEGSDGELGQNTAGVIGASAGSMESLNPINFGTNKTAVQIAVGADHNCAILNDGTVKCWGYNGDGELGQNNTTNVGDGVGPSVASISAINLGVNKTAVQIAAADAHTCAILNDGTVKCWGYNGYGELGQNNTTNVGDGVGPSVASISPVNLGVNKSAVQIAAGGSYTCAILNDGSLKCWGYNGDGELGQNNTTNVGDSVAHTMANLNPINLGANKTAVQIAARGLSPTTCAILNDGSLKCWGYNGYGELGQNNTTNVGDSVAHTMANLNPINLGANKTAVQVTVGPFNVCAILNDGSLKCWGSNQGGQLGLDLDGFTLACVGDGVGPSVASTSPINLGVNKTAVQVALGTDFGNQSFIFTCALLNDATVKCWGGGGSFGVLGQDNNTSAGNGSGTAMADLGPVLNFGTNTTPIQIAAGQNHNCAVLAGGATKCWGRNDSGQLGQDSTINAGDSVAHTMANLNPINLGANNTALQTAAGAAHSCAVLNDHSVKCWGANASGQLGQDTTTNVSDSGAHSISALSSINLGSNMTALQVVTGDNHSCAVLNDHSVKCWGLNSSGQLGQNSATAIGTGGGSMAALSAINLGTNKTALFLTAGASHTCAVLNDGTSKCWGANASGQLGQDSTTNAGDGAGTAMAALSAINVGTNKTALSITAGASHTCAVLNDGTSKCWGANASGQLGQNSTTAAGNGGGTAMAALPAINLGANLATVQMTAGASHTCAVLNNYTSKCWGANASGQLGQDSTTNAGDGAGTSMAALSAINVGANKTALQVVAGAAHTCVILSDGSIKCWGDNTYGQLGQNSTSTWGSGASPSTIMSILAPAEVP